MRQLLLKRKSATAMAPSVLILLCEMLKYVNNFRFFKTSHSSLTYWISFPYKLRVLKDSQDFKSSIKGERFDN